MTPQRWKQVKAILADAIECDDAFGRTAVVESSCAGDPLLRREVEELLVYADKPEGERQRPLLPKLFVNRNLEAMHHRKFNRGLRR